MGFLAIFCGILWILGTLLVPETYAPVLLRCRAQKLSEITGKHYISKLDHKQEQATLGKSLKIALSRPLILLFKEPIVFLLSLYLSIIYGTLYMLFAAFPIVFQKERGWNQGIGGLAFLGILVGMVFAIAYTIPDNRHYIKVQQKHGGFAPPRGPAFRLDGRIYCAPSWPLLVRLDEFPSIHFLASIAAAVPFGFGMVLVFLSVFNYLIDSYTIFAASVLAANTVLRSCFGAAFPLFTSYMYANLGYIGHPRSQRFWRCSAFLFLFSSINMGRPSALGANLPPNRPHLCSGYSKSNNAWDRSRRKRTAAAHKKTRTAQTMSPPMSRPMRQ